MGERGPEGKREREREVGRGHRERERERAGGAEGVFGSERTLLEHIC